MNNAQKKVVVKSMVELINELLKFEPAVDGRIKRLDAMMYHKSKSTTVVYKERK